MSRLSIRIVTPHVLLQPFVYKMFVLEGSYGVAEEEMKRISPNGTVKFVLMYKSDMNSTLETTTRHFDESSICIVGQMTKSTVVDPQGEFGIICIEFNPMGVYRLFDFPLHEITNSFYRENDVFGTWGGYCQERIADMQTVAEKVDLLQELVVHRLYESSRGDEGMDYAIGQIVSHHGLLRIEDLSSEVGYSKRHFNRKFQAYVGVSPKANIYRFQWFYELGWKDGSIDPSRLGDFYYDQSHFIREFKRFTGESPMAYFRKNEQLSHIFYT